MADFVLTSLATRQADWLAVRQKAVAENIAHASSPGYRAVGVKPFSSYLNKTMGGLDTTSPLHMGTDRASVATVAVRARDASEISHSGNSVNVEQEMLDANDIHRSYAMNVGIVRSFNRMMLSVVKG